MDVLSDILNHVEMTTSLYYRTELTAPWGIRVGAFQRVARFHICLLGSFWLSLDGTHEVEVMPGDVILVLHGKAHDMKDHPQTAVLDHEEVKKLGVYHPGELLRYSSGSPAHAKTRFSEGTELICGHFEFKDDTPHPLLASLPDVIHIKKESASGIQFSWLHTALDFIDYESLNRDPGAFAIINKLSEVIFIQSLRAYMKDNRVNTPFLAALNDQYIRKSIQEIHHNPGHKWRLDSLAKVAGLSRTVYAERFLKLTGMTPMKYVTHWRMEKAKRLLQNEALSVDEVASQVGYGASESFQKTFKKIVGVTPSSFRKTARV